MEFYDQAAARKVETMAGDRAIALGGSAGSIDVFKIILDSLPAKLAAPIFAVVHVGSAGLNVLAQIFDASTGLPVTTAVDGEPVKPGHVYVAPADHHLIVADRTIRLGRGPRENMSRPAVDPLFRSIGLAYGTGAIGVLVSGYLNDGASGLADLKRCGGLSVVQNPRDAQAEDMPLAALRASDIDYRAPADEIGDLLVGLLAAEVPPLVSPPNDIALEVEIALGRPIDSEVMKQLAEPSVITCPACGGVLSQMHHRSPVRFRCQVGHAFTGEVLAKEQDTGIDEAVRVALRIVEERAALTQKLADEARSAGRARAAEDYDRRTDEFPDLR